MPPVSAICWKGSVAITPGMGIFMGVSGDNAPHRHWAHQLTVGLEGCIEVRTNTRTIQSPGVFIPANCSHQLRSARIFSLYIDPTAVLPTHLLANMAAYADVKTLPASMLDVIKTAFSTPCKFDQQLVLLRQSLLGGNEPDVDPRFVKVLGYLNLHLHEPELVSRTNLANLIAMSASRFSHWFEERAGIALRSYLKWLRLITGIEHVLQGEGYANAAHSASFSDQAHFTRTFVEAFGIQPSVALKQVNSKIL
jgi:AraC-like DNA-binding protein